MMRPEFAFAIDPIFEYTIGVLEQLESATTLAPEEVQENILRLIDQADLALGASKQWQLSRYAIAVWIDEVLLTMPWSGAAWWRDHILEMELFHSRICHVRFFELARDASGLQCRDALEVFYNCVLLGFRGMYAEQVDGSMNGDQTDWPASIEQWLGRTYRLIHVTAWQPAFGGVRRSISGAPPCHARTSVVWWSVGATALLLASGALLHFVYWNK